MRILSFFGIIRSTKIVTELSYESKNLLRNYLVTLKCQIHRWMYSLSLILTFAGLTKMRSIGGLVQYKPRRALAPPGLLRLRNLTIAYCADSYSYTRIGTTAFTYDSLSYITCWLRCLSIKRWHTETAISIHI